MVGLLVLLVGNVKYVPARQEDSSASSGPEGLSGLYGVSAAASIPSVASGAGVGGHESPAGTPPAVPPATASHAVPERRGAGALATPRLPPLSSRLPETSDSAVRVEFAGGDTVSWVLPESLLWEDSNAGQIPAAHRHAVPRVGSGSATYANTYVGLWIDAEYVSGPRSLKENLLLQSRPPTPAAGTEWLVVPFELAVPENLDARVGHESVTTPGLRTSRQVDFGTDAGIAFHIAEPLVYEAENRSARAPAEYVVSRNGSHLHLALAVPADWLLDPGRTFPVVLDPTINSGDFTRESADFTVAGIGLLDPRGADVAVGDIVGDGHPDALFLGVDSVAFGLWPNQVFLRTLVYGVCQDIRATDGSCATAILPHWLPVSSSNEDWASRGAGVALGDLDATGSLDALFVTVSEVVVGTFPFTVHLPTLDYFICLNLAADGACGAVSGLRTLSLLPSFSVREVAVSLADVDSDGALDAIFTVLVPGLGAPLVVACYQIDADGVCPAGSVGAIFAGPDLSGPGVLDVTSVGFVFAPLNDNDIPDAFLSLTEMVNVAGNLRFWTRYWVCYDFEIGGTTATCRLWGGPHTHQDFDAPDLLGTFTGNLADFTGGGIALFTDYHLGGDLDGNRSLDALVTTLDCCLSGQFSTFRTRMLFDGFVQDEFAANGTSELPFLPYLILHDPNGDGSHSEVAVSSTRESVVSVDVARSTSSSSDWEVYAIVDVGESDSTTHAQIKGNQFVVSHTTSETYTSSQSTDPACMGPGYGDVLVGQYWTLDWAFYNRTYDVGGQLQPKVVLDETAHLQASETKTACKIRDDPDPALQAALQFDLGLNNTSPGPGEAEFRSNHTFHTGESKTETDGTATASSRSVAWVLEMSHETYAGLQVDLYLGDMVSVGVGGHAKSGVAMTLTVGQSVTNTGTLAKDATYYLGDADTSADAGEDTIRERIYMDTAFGTWHFWTDENQSRTSMPHEPWTQRTDILPPRLRGVTVDPKRLRPTDRCVGEACVLPYAFTLTVELQDGAGLSNVSAVLKRVSSWTADYGTITSLPLNLTNLCTGTGFYTCTLPGRSTEDLEGMYVVNISAVDGEGNPSGWFENRGAFVVTVDGSALVVDTIVRRDEVIAPGRADFDFNQESPAIPITLSVETDQNVTEEYSVSVVQFTSYPNASSDEATAAIFIEIEASQNLDDAVGSVMICIGYDPNDLPLNPDGTRVAESTLKLTWYDHTTSQWVELNSTVDEDANILCGETPHFSLYGPFGNFRPLAVLGFATLSVDEGVPVAFDAAGSYDRDGHIVAYAWDFGDESPAEMGSAMTHTYGDDGTYEVRLSVTDDGGETGQATALVTVANLPPHASFVFIPAGPEGTALTYAVWGTDAGSDDLTFSWDFGDGLTATQTRYNDGMGPDGSESPLGTFPFAATDAQTHAYGDDGVFPTTVQICDDDGACAIAAANITVANVAPAVSLQAVPAGPEGTSLEFLATATDPGSDDLSFAWSGECAGWSATTYWNDVALGPDPDPSPTVNPRSVTDTQDVVCGDDGVYAWDLRVEDDDGGVTTLSGAFRVDNLPPTLAVSPPSVVSLDEASSVSFTAKAVDAGSDDLAFTWSWALGPTEVRTYHNDGVGPDPAHSPAGTYPFAATDTSTHVYGDDCVCLVSLRVEDDDGGFLLYETAVTVINVDPVIEDVWVYAVADVTLRVAGEKWHDVRVDIEAYGGVTDTASVTRYPGSPDEQSATIIGGRVHLLGTPRIFVSYTPEDDPMNGQPNGGTPVWVTLTFTDGYAVEFHHTFTADRSETWVLTLDYLRPSLVGRPLTFEAEASDLGSDDLAFAWDFGDGGTWAETVFSDGVGPDPYPSPDLRPAGTTVAATHPYGSDGPFTATLRLADDDGGSTARTVIVPL